MPFGGESADSYYDEGLTCVMKGELDRAIEHLDKAITLEPGFAAAWHQLGRCYYRKGDAQQAIQALTNATTKSGRLVAAKVDLGYALLLARKIEGAKQCFSEVLDERSDNIRAVLGLAYCAYQLQQWDIAINVADRVSVTAGADSFEALFLVGRAAFMLKQRELSLNRLYAADALLDKVIETSPDQPEGYYLRGQIYSLTGEHAKALQAFQTAEPLAKPDRRYTAYHEHFGLVDIVASEGWCHKQLDHAGAAKEAGKRVLELKPGSRRGKQLAGEPEQPPTP